MSLLDGAGLTPAPDGGPPSAIAMPLLDRVPCAAVLGPLQLLQERVLIRCQDPELGRFLKGFLAAFSLAAEPRTVLHLVEVGGRWVAYQDGSRAVAADSVPALARWLVWQLNAMALAAPSPHVHVHAAVASLNGRAVILPGRSGAGKSTLVTALVLAGWTYLTDEVAVLDSDRLVVHPYPRALALEPGSWPLVREALDRWPPDVPALVTDLRLVLPGPLGSAPAAAAEPVAVVFPEVVPGSIARLEGLGRADAFERLLDLTFNLRGLGPPGFDRLADLVRCVTCHRLVIDGVQGADGLLAPLVSTLARRW